MNDIFVMIGGCGFAELHQDKGLIEIKLPEWSGFLSREQALRQLGNLRKFCDQAEAALGQESPAGQGEGTAQS